MKLVESWRSGNKHQAKHDYIDVCKLAYEDDKTFNKFKSIGEYRLVLEHSSKKIGLDHLNNIKKDNPYLLEHIDKFIKNDSIGEPVVYDYDELGKISPSTLYYVGVLSNLINIFSSLNNLNIVEIGGGYGGQCKIIYDYFTPKSYRIFDLKEVTLLQKKYLSHFGLNDILFSSNLDNDFYNIDLVISNYAISEMTNKYQHRYYNNVISNSTNGYITSNVKELAFFDKLNHKFKVNRMNDVESEKSSNYILYWKGKK